MKNYLDMTLDIMLNSWLEGDDFTEGAGIFAESKFQKAISPALQATYALARYHYGVEKDGQIYDIDRSEYPKWYHYLTREEFNKYKGGLSYDYCRFLYPYLTSKGYDTTLYFIEIEGTNVNHMLPMIKVPYGDRYRYLYCEAALKQIYGCYSTDNPDGLLSSIVSVLKTYTIITKPTNVIIRKVKVPKDDDLNYNELMKKLRKGEVYDKYVTKPRSGISTKNVKASKFNPDLLSKINPDIVRLK